MVDLFYEGLIQKEDFEHVRGNSSLLVPIPLHRSKLNQRGYNQAELIARKIIELDGNTNFTLEKNVLIKVTETKRQAHIKNRNERLRNLSGSFGIKNQRENQAEYMEQNEIPLKGKNIILIDDITTTGATLTEAKKTLKNAGARKVIAFTVAH